MKKKGLFLLAFVFLLLSINFISAQQPNPTQTNINIVIGLQIETTKINVLKNSQDYLFNAHVFNISTGLRVDNATTECNFHISNSKGEHIIDQQLMNFDLNGLDWEINVLGENFTENGAYSYLIVCNSTSNIGGFISVPIEVTQTGFSLETSESLLYIIILLATFLLFLGFLYPAITLPYSNKVEPDGSIRRIMKVKYLKLLSLWFAYGFLMWFLQTLNAVSKSFISLDYLSNFITNIFTYSQLFSVVVTFLILTIMFIEVWKDIILSETIKRYGKALVNGDLK